MHQLIAFLRDTASSVRALRLAAYICFPVGLLLVGTGVALGKGWVSQATFACAAIPLLLGLTAHIKGSIIDADAHSDSWTDDDLDSAYTRVCDRVYWVLTWPLVPFVFLAVSMIERQNAKKLASDVISRARRMRG